MSPSNRAGGTVETDAPTTERASNGNGRASGNGHTGNGDGDDAPRAKRRTTITNGVPMPERGSASQRGTSSSSISRKPAPTFSEDEVAPAAPVLPDPIPLPGPSAPEATVEDLVFSDPPATPNVYDDAASSEPFGIPMNDSSGEILDLEPLPLQGLSPTIEPAARGSQPTQLPDPVWTPAAVPDVPLEPPYVTTSMTTAHKVAPVQRPVGRRPRVRRVTRVVRHVDPWSVFKIALVFNLVLYGVLLTAGVLLWNVAYATGTIDNIERFFESFGWSEFEFNGGAIYHSAWIAGLFGVIGLTGIAVLAATLFNLITDLVGGVRFTVLEEEVVERTLSPMRRFVVRRNSAPMPDAEAAGDASGEVEVPNRTEPVDVSPGSLDDRPGL